MRNFIDIVLDTHILSEVIAQYFRKHISTHGIFELSEKLSDRICEKFNLILNDHREEGFSTHGKLVASNFGFIEIGRKFEEISNGQYTLDEFRAFIDSPPEWFLFEDLNTSLIQELEKLPSHVNVGSNQKPVEWADALHAATVLLRGDRSLLATCDTTLINIELLKGRLI